MPPMTSFFIPKYPSLSMKNVLIASIVIVIATTAIVALMPKTAQTPGSVSTIELHVSYTFGDIASDFTRVGDYLCEDCSVKISRAGETITELPVTNGTASTQLENGIYELEVKSARSTVIGTETLIYTVTKNDTISVTLPWIGPV